MKKVVYILIIITTLLLVKVSVSFTMNEIIIKNYNNGNDNNNLVEKLYILNYPEPYIAYYNHGTILYTKGLYIEAEEKFKTALNKRPPQDRVCDIQINLVLSQIQQIDMTDSENALKKLKVARNILYENHCANPKDDSGKSEGAEQLEEEIKELEKELGGSGEEEENNNNQENNEENNNENDKEQELEQKLKENRQDANENRQETLQYFDPNDPGYSYTEKPW